MHVSSGCSIFLVDFVSVSLKSSPDCMNHLFCLNGLTLGGWMDCAIVFLSSCGRLRVFSPNALHYRPTHPLPISLLSRF